jgi:hypothetical protein
MPKLYYQAGNTAYAHTIQSYTTQPYPVESNNIFIIIQFHNTHYRKL